MIKSINSSGRHVMISGGNTSPTYMAPNPGVMGAGNTRYNTQSQYIEVYDGYNWSQLNMSHTTIGLTYDAECAIDWAFNKSREEAELARLAESNSTIADLLDQKKELESKIKMVQILVKDHNV